MKKERKPLGLYIHIPFCKSKCIYCDFYSLPNAEEQMDRYTPCGHRTAVSLRSGSVGYAFWQEEFLRQTQEFLQTNGR